MLHAAHPAELAELADLERLPPEPTGARGAGPGGALCPRAARRVWRCGVAALLLAAGCRAEPSLHLCQSIEAGDVLDVVNATGAVGARTVVNIGSQASGTVAAVHTNVGARVARGDVLIELDARLARGQLARAEAAAHMATAAQARAALALEHARRALARARPLHEAQLSAAIEHDAAVLAHDDAELAHTAAGAARAQAEAERTLARTNLQLTRIVSPIDGVVLDRQVDVGQTVAAQFQVATLLTVAADMAEVQVQAQIDEADIARVRVGMPVQFGVDAHPGRSFGGTLERLHPAPTVQPGQSAGTGQVVTYAAVVAAHNGDGALLQGMTAHVSIVVAERRDVLRLPVAALRFVPDVPGAAAQRGAAAARPAAGGRTPALAAASDVHATDAPGDDAAGGERATVYVGGDAPGRAPQPREVRLGLSDGSAVEVRSGLVAGDCVTVARVHDGRRSGGL